MHDPLTQAFEIHWPWNYMRLANDRRIRERYEDMPRWKRPSESPRHRYFTPAITIWHKDPELKGDDDSCGWFRPPMTRQQRERVHACAWHESYSPVYQRTAAKQLDDLVLAETLMRGCFVYVSRVLGIALNAQELLSWPADLTFDPNDNGLSALSFLPGWHTNGLEDSQKTREDHARQLMLMVANYILRKRRPWFRHPRWHIAHWQLQVHVLQSFKRWAFSRCCKCGKGFAWGYSPCSGSWSGTGPLWFRSEKNVYHSECDRPNTESVAASVA